MTHTHLQHQALPSLVAGGGQPHTCVTSLVHEVWISVDVVKDGNEEHESEEHRCGIQLEDGLGMQTKHVQKLLVAE